MHLLLNLIDFRMQMTIKILSDVQRSAMAFEWLREVVLTTLRRKGSSLGRCLCMYCAPMASCIELLQMGQRRKHKSVRAQELEHLSARPGHAPLQQHTDRTHLRNVRRRLASGQPAASCSSSSPSTTSSSTSSALFRSMADAPGTCGSQRHPPRAVGVAWQAHSDSPGARGWGGLRRSLKPPGSDRGGYK